MNTPNDHQLFDRIRALPRAEVAGPLAEFVRQRVLAILDDEVIRPAGPREFIAAALVTSGVLAYFGWAIAFVLFEGG